jgi:hypothetical protein
MSARSKPFALLVLSVTALLAVAVFATTRVDGLSPLELYGLSNEFSVIKEVRSDESESVSLDALQVKVNTSSAAEPLVTFYAEPPIAFNSELTFPSLDALLATHQNIFLFELGNSTRHHGFGSIVLHLLLRFQLYFDETQHRTLVLDQSQLNAYRLNSTHGLFSGFLSTNFVVLDDASAKKKAIRAARQRLPVKHKLEHAWTPKEPGYDAPIVTISQTKRRSWKKSMKLFWATNRYFANVTNTTMFDRMRASACGIQMTCETEARSAALLRKNSIPLFDAASDQNNSGTVAFHIRRGDKLEWESRAYQVEEYVATLLRRTTLQEQEAIHSCYVATDDFTVVAELRVALHKAAIDCTLYSLATDTFYMPRDRNHAFVLFADLHMLVGATYFVGSFNSNLGKITALWRGCPVVRRVGASAANQFHDYYRSYGVDTDEWYVV